MTVMQELILLSGKTDSYSAKIKMIRRTPSKKGSIIMEILWQPDETDVYIPEEHPWLEVPDSNLDEEVRFALDELRF